MELESKIAKADDTIANRFMEQDSQQRGVNGEIDQNKFKMKQMTEKFNKRISKLEGVCEG